MSLAPVVTVTLGNLQYDSHVSALRVDLALLPAINTFRLSLPQDVKFTAGPGDDSILEVDGGEGAETVLTGKIRAVRRTFREIQVSAADAGADLSTLRPTTTYQNKSAADVIRALAGDVGANLGSIDIDLDLAAYVGHQGRTAAEHVAYLAMLAGGITYVNGDNELDVVLRPGEQADAALLYGREFVEYTQTAIPAPRATRFAIGNGTAGSTGSPDVFRPSLNRLPEDAAGAGTDAIWQPAPILRTPKAATTGSQALGDRAAAYVRQFQARCFLLPALRPGMVIEIQELPGDLGGNTWLLTRVTHHLRPNVGGETRLEGVLAGASGGSLLGALIGALGSLL